MSLVSAAALSFTSCSSNDDLAGNAGQAKVDGFYMTLTVQTPNASGTRTVQSNEYAATVEESKITSGTFFLMDSKNKIVFSKKFEDLAWDKSGKTQLEIPVENVIAGAEYKVYFLANTDSKDPLNSTFSFTATTATTDNKFVGDYAKANSFAMFNENDKNVDGNTYTVTFQDENKSKDKAAKVNKTIKLERITARIDQPTSGVTEITAFPTDADHTATAEEQKAMKDAINKVDKIELTRYAISNVANTTNIMQKWDNTPTNPKLLIPSTATGFKYIQPTTEFGTPTLFQNAGYFKAIKDTEGHVNANKDYVFENNASSTAATSMYFEYTVKLKDMTNADFPKDGTFYRYNNVIYKSFADIYEAYNNVPGLFKDKSAANMKALVNTAKTATTAEAIESELDKIRQEYDIEIFNEGKTYYKMAIKDKFIGYDNAIQRNTVYQLNVKNVFNVGAQVPNGTPDKTGLFYLDVEVSVNPWVLNTQDVELQ